MEIGPAGLGRVAMVFSLRDLALASSGVFDRECGTPVTRSGIDRGAVRTLLCRPEGDFLQMNPVRNDSFRSSQARERA